MFPSCTIPDTRLLFFHGGDTRLRKDGSEFRTVRTRREMGGGWVNRPWKHTTCLTWDTSYVGSGVRCRCGLVNRKEFLEVSES